MCQQLGWLVNLEKSELEPKQDLDFVGYQFDLRSGRVRLTPDRWQRSSSRPISYKTHSVASLEGFRITKKGDPNPQVPAPPFTMVAEGRQCAYRPTITPNKTCSANIYRRINRRVGRSLE